MISPEFKKQYEKLNPEQRQAVDAIEGPVMVIAGPGTGKTQILSLRIANILRKTDTEAGSILALTFTESASYSMRSRLQKIIGPQAYRVKIFTFHGFCNDVIKNYPDYFPRIIGSQSASEVDRIKILKDILIETPFKYLKPFGDPDYYVSSVLSSIQKLKRDNISPQKLEKFIKTDEKNLKDIIKSGEKISKAQLLRTEKKNAKNRELVVIYKEYEKTLAMQLLYDYEDMILEVIKSLELNEDLLLSLQEEYQYILADEHQDANNSQNLILELLSNFHKSPNIFIVGDEKQAIYRFQGASLENFLYFKKLYSNALILSLKSNYRSTQTILDASHSLIEKNEVSDPNLRNRLFASKTSKFEERKILLYEFSKPVFENYFLADDISKKISSGIDPQSIAIIYRNNSDAFPFIKSLEKADIPIEVNSGQSLFIDDNIRKLIVLLEAINTFGDETYLSELLFIDFFDFDNLDVYKLLNFSKRRNLDLFDLFSSITELKLCGLSDVDKFLDFYTNFKNWSRLAKNKSLVDFIEIIIRESGYLRFLLGGENLWEELNKLESFFNHAKELALRNNDSRLSDFVEYLIVLKHHNIQSKSSSDYGPKKQSVRLMTAHKAKGLEFDYVYLVNAYDGHWGGGRKPKHFDLPSTPFEAGLEDERRLFYVALTRAKKEITVSFSREDQNGKHRLIAQFVSEIDEKYITRVQTSNLEKKYFNKSKIRPTKLYKQSKDDKEYLRELFFDRGFSVTALNNYLECPWKYFFENLLRLPKAPSKSQMYGIAVHKALEELFKKYKQEDKISDETLILYFKNSLIKQPLSRDEFNDTFKKGEESLRNYYSFYNHNWNRNIALELKIQGIIIDNINIKNKDYSLILNGKIDKIEFLENNNVNVVDYKTSQPKTRNQILGLTKDSTGDIYRQLLFYKILLDRFNEGKFKMISGEIDFTERTKSGSFKKEKFMISETDTTDLVELIKEKAREIANFSFWNKFCSKNDCRYCVLRKSMKTNR